MMITDKLRLVILVMYELGNLNPSLLNQKSRPLIFSYLFAYVHFVAFPYLMVSSFDNI